MATFSDTLSHCIATRRDYSNIFKTPTSCKFVADEQDQDGAKITFLYQGLLHVSSVKDFQLGSEGWKQLSIDNTKPVASLTREEKLLRERMRKTGSNSKYDYFANKRAILLHGSAPILLSIKGEILTCFPCADGAIGLQAFPFNPSLLAYVNSGDMFLSDGTTGKVHQLTFTKERSRVSAGSPPFIIQEEFDRYAGFQWQNVDSDGSVLRILYEEVNEEGVETVQTFNPACQSLDEYLYPRPGKMNAKSVLKLLVLSFSENQHLIVEEQHMAVPLSDIFPHCSEYLVRFGWMPGGGAVWVQLLDRQQRHLVLAVVGLGCFASGGKSDGGSAGSSSMDSQVYVLWEERSSLWTYVTDCLEFLPSDNDLLRFLWLSDSSGYRHLYLVEATPPSGMTSGGVPHAQCTTKQLTHGNWSILGNKVWVDVRSELVYFQANKESPLEKHLYVIGCSGNGEPKRLTRTGYYHDVTLDTDDFRYFLSVFSNTSSRVIVSVHPLNEQAESLSEWCAPTIPSGYTPPIPFTTKSETGEELYGVIYPPENREEGVKVPAIIYVYGGPCVQFVTCALNKQLPRIQSWRQHGYAVIMLDNRGSANRGVQFEAVVKGQMGHSEVQDQVVGVRTAVETVDFIDINRIAIMGWSYGGYLSLMAIIQHPSLFKLCIAGAPVTDWLDYDTGYTERYLGTLPENMEAYSQSSVLQYASRLPSEIGRLLLVHGLCDENVFFKHSAKLCDKLVALGKPHVTQFYCQERHGLRSTSALVHCDATILEFLKANL